MRRSYGISFKEAERILESQGGLCAMCGEPVTFLEPGAGNAKRYDFAAVDRCHKTGKVRGILHGRCNIALGHLGDSPEMADRAGEYLRRHL